MNSGLDTQLITHTYKKHRFLLLLILLVLHIVLAISFEGEQYLLLRTTLISLALLAAIGCLQVKRRSVTYFNWFGIITIVTGWVQIVFQLPGVSIMSGAFRIAFFLLVTGALIYQIARSREVSSSVIIGAIDGYLLLGTVGAVACTIIETASPGAFHSAGSQLGQSGFLYYSFVTMATVGYGDIVPVAPVARSLATLLAISGQIYVAVLLALLVGKYAGSRV